MTEFIAAAVAAVGANTTKKVGLRVVPTYRCDRSCPFCYESVETRACPTFLLRLPIDKLPEDFNPAYVTLLGGELAAPFNQKATKQLLLSIQDAYPFCKKTLITNGCGNLDFYEDLTHYGITDFTFSINSYNQEINMLEKIRKLGANPRFSVRINMFFDMKKFLENEEVFIPIWDVSSALPLGFKHTLCADILCKDEINIDEVIDKINHFIEHRSLGEFEVTGVYRFSNFVKVECSSPNESHNKVLEFWISLPHTDGSFDKNEWIVLPDGTVTDDFADVVAGKGKGPVRITGWLGGISP